MVVYVNDILVCSETYEDHLKHLKIFANECFKHGIILSERKVRIKKKEIEFLGLILDKYGIKLQSYI